MTEQRQVIRAGDVQRPDAVNHRRLDWFRDAKFGMFVHWGLYAIPSGIWGGRELPSIGEWIMKKARIPVAEYEQLAARFDPAGFDAAQWVSLAKRAGQKYLTVTAKHHDGFCLFDSQHTDYTIVRASPFGRDPMKELAAECERQGVRLCFYYSQTQDWHHPGGDGNDWDFDVPDDGSFDAYLQDYVKPQLSELLTNYGPIGLIWFDTPKRITAEQSRQLVDLVHELQPDCLVNGRIGNALGDYASADDQVFPAAAEKMDWEACMTMNDTWGFKSTDQNWKSSELMIHQLIDAVSKGGNYLLNVGPTAEGVIPPPSVDRLAEIGDWLAANGEAIYATRPGPIQGVDFCRSTARDRTVYLHVLDWPVGGTIELPHPGGTVDRARLLADGTPLRVREESDRLLIDVPTGAPDPVAAVVVWETQRADATAG